MTSLAPFNEGTIEAIAGVLGEAGRGTDITRYLDSQGLTDSSRESTKWRRLLHVFQEIQRATKSANQILAFIQSYLTPARFANRSAEFEIHRTKLNAILLMAGLELGSDGQWRKKDVAKSLGEAESRAKGVRHRFTGRRMHPEIFKYCTAELMQDNYFHAVFEACKGLAQRIRDMAKVHGDGAGLVDQAFRLEAPLLAFNTLQTETEKSEHKGFAALLKGCFAAIRNPLAHEPKILWQGEDDAVDYFTLISMLHYKLDVCVPTGHQPQP